MSALHASSCFIEYIKRWWLLVVSAEHGKGEVDATSYPSFLHNNERELIGVLLSNTINTILFVQC